MLTLSHCVLQYTGQTHDLCYCQADTISSNAFIHKQEEINDEANENVHDQING